MSDDERMDALTEEVLPALVARLRASRLGEIEVARDGWRVRLRRDLGATTPGASAIAGVSAADGATAEPVSGSVARSPGVGYFSPAATLTVGRDVSAGDLLGSVDVLGIAQDVTAPEDGIVSRVVADEGQAVEYGQVLAEIDPLGGAPAAEDEAVER